MTSNIGSRQLKDFGEGIGFSTSAKRTSRANFARGVIENALKKTFAPEFLNRIDDVVIFDSLEMEDIHKIIDIELKFVFKRVLDLGFQVQLTEKAKNYVVEKGWDIQFGARPLKRAIQKYIEDPLAEEIIKSKIHPGDMILVDYIEESDEIKVMVQKAELAKK